MYFSHEIEATIGEMAQSGRAVGERLNQALALPLRELLARPAKQFRADMVAIGYALAGARAERAPASPLELARLQTLANAIEAIHTGSLIVDDIQDGSQLRRGGPSLHESFGIPIALNAGNSLYFWPLEWIRRLDLSESLELKLYRLVHGSLFRAHLGQALDLGAPIDSVPQERVPSICWAALELKTGELMALALAVGATLGGAEPARLAVLVEFGRRFGVALQMHDDIGNLSLPHGSPKRLEDLRLRRPTWVWSEVARHSSPDDYARFVAAVRGLPDEIELESWLGEFEFHELARDGANSYLDAAMVFLKNEIRPTKRFSGALRGLDEMAERIASAYGRA